MIIPIISLALILLNLLCKKDRAVFISLWIFMVIVACMNTYNIDWDAYEFMYGLIDSLEKCNLTDIGYGFLNYIANAKLSLTFFEFRLLFMFVGILILKHIIKCNSPYPALVLALYFIAPFFPNDIIQIRNFMAQAILSLFLAKWIESDKNKVVYLAVGLILATAMHSTTIYFAIFILLLFIDNDKLLYLIVFIGSLSISSLPVLLSKIPFIPTEKINFYLGKMSSGIDVRGIVIIIAFAIQLYILYNIKKYARNTNDKGLIVWSDVVYKMNILCIPACIIMTMWTFNFYRVPRDLLLLNYIVYSKYLYSKKDNKIINSYTCVFIVLGLCWSILNSISQWPVIWNNNAMIRW